MRIGLTPEPGTTVKTIDEKTLKMLVEAGTLRDLRAVRQGEGWSLQAHLGADWLTVCSAREAVRAWLSLVAVERFCVKLGIKLLTVEL